MDILDHHRDFLISKQIKMEEQIITMEMNVLGTI